MKFLRLSPLLTVPVVAVVAALTLRPQPAHTAAPPQPLPVGASATGVSRPAQPAAPGPAAIAPVVPAPVAAAVAGTPSVSSWSGKVDLAPLAGRHIGLQIGHMQTDQLPDELADLRAAWGGAEGTWRELDVNYAVTERAADLLRGAGARVDVLPATVPAGYKADAFIAIHSDQDQRLHTARGYKVSGSDFAGPDQATGDQLADAIAKGYAPVTGLPEDTRPDAISDDMRYYYAFNFHYYRHAIAPNTPGAIVEMGFVTDPADRLLLFGQPDRAAAGLAAGIDSFLTNR